MKKRMVLLAAVLFASCAGEHDHDVGIPVEEEPPHPHHDSTPVPVGASSDPIIETVAPAPEPVRSPEGLEAEVITLARSIPARRAHPVRTAVQMAPSMYVDAFSEDPEIRRAARRRFSRTRPESFNLEGDPELFELTVLVLSRLCVSEANWLHDERWGRADQNLAELDCPAIYQVLRRTRRNGETLIGVMRRHSHFVTEQWAPRSPRTRWVVELNSENRRPEHFPAALNWTRDYLPRWLAMQEFVRELLRGEHLGTCAGAPIITWGGRCDDVGGACDDHLAERRGLVPYSCDSPDGRLTSNRFWCRPGTPGCDGPPLQSEEAPAPPEVTPTGT